MKLPPPAKPPMTLSERIIEEHLARATAQRLAWIEQACAESLRTGKHGVYVPVEGKAYVSMEVPAGHIYYEPISANIQKKK